LRPADLEAIARLDAESSTTRQPPVFTLSDILACLGDHPSVVAVADGAVIGAALSRVDSDRAWVLRLTLSPRWRGRGLGSDLLAALEQRLLPRGVSRIGALLPAGDRQHRLPQLRIRGPGRSQLLRENRTHLA